MCRVGVGTLVAITIALFLLACAKVEPTPVPTEPFPATAIPPTSTPPPTVAPTAIPTPTTVVARLPATGINGGSLGVASSASFPHRDVRQSVQESLTSLGPGISYSRLLRLKTAPGQTQPNLSIECDLCQSWTLTKDLIYEFELRPDIAWQDVPPVNGRLLTAQDLTFSYGRLGTPGWPNESLVSPFGEVSAISDSTLSVKLNLPDADALLSLADGHAKVVASETVEQFGDLKAVSYTHLTLPTNREV